jgi:hypothetical protein
MQIIHLSNLCLWKLPGPWNEAANLLLPCKWSIFLKDFTSLHPLLT